LGQATLNTWFASKSYVLVPRVPTASQREVAEKRGLGICWLQDNTVREIEARSYGLPTSYASWLVAEWAWRFSRGIPGFLSDYCAAILA
jgi:hypothetical protein